MSIDSSGSIPGPIGLTVPPPQEDTVVSEPAPEPVPPPEPPPAPLPSYQGNRVDESI
ncbi:MAG TPA: hypothetical protein PLB48_02715 [Treponema sp.]|jgi:hypothetical protein|nr:hypothetical protein [Treponema sp.]HON13549.1 hypothetical protein [Treponema sp.]HPC70696.1 hypothetical protein [Treponema sp.]HRS03177.1 hypothetical protein [Treponema sp.]